MLMWCILLLVLGLALIFLEMFIPSAGVLSFFAALSVLAAVVLAFLKFGLIGGGLFFCAAAIIVPAVVMLAVTIYPHTPLGRLAIGPLPRAEDVLPDDAQSRDRPRLQGLIGIAKTPLLPGGTVKIEGRTYDAISSGPAVDRGQAVLVVEVRRRHLVVRLVEEDPSVKAVLRAEVAGSDQPRPRPTTEAEILEQPIEALGLESLDDPLA